MITLTNEVGEKFTYREVSFFGSCTTCLRENLPVFRSDGDINFDAAICEDCLRNTPDVEID